MSWDVEGKTTQSKPEEEMSGSRVKETSSYFDSGRYPLLAAAGVYYAQSETEKENHVGFIWDF